MTLAKRTLESTPDSIYQSRVDLAAAHRLANKFGFDDGIHNHFTLVVPGATDQFLVKTHGLLMSEITANNLIVVDTLGNVIQGLRNYRALCVLYTRSNSYSTSRRQVCTARASAIQYVAC